MAITHLNPASLHANPAFSQGTLIPAGSSIIMVGGQNGVDAVEDHPVVDAIGGEKVTPSLFAHAGHGTRSPAQNLSSFRA